MSKVEAASDLQKGREKRQSLVENKEIPIRKKASLSKMSSQILQDFKESKDIYKNDSKVLEVSPEKENAALPFTKDQAPIVPPLTQCKEAFSAFCHQRHKKELKRLFRHMHPELKNFGDVLQNEIQDAPHTESSEDTVETRYQGEVQSLRWIFENWTFDEIGELQTLRNSLEEESPTEHGVNRTTVLHEHTNSDHVQMNTPDVEKHKSNRDNLSLTNSNTEAVELLEGPLREHIQGLGGGQACLRLETKESKTLDRRIAKEVCSPPEINVKEKEYVKRVVQLYQAGQSTTRNTKISDWHFETLPKVDVKQQQEHPLKQMVSGASEIVKSFKWVFETQPGDETINNYVNMNKKSVDGLQTPENTGQLHAEKDPATTRRGEIQFNDIPESKCYADVSLEMYKNSSKDVQVDNNKCKDNILKTDKSKDGNSTKNICSVKDVNDQSFFTAHPSTDLDQNTKAMIVESQALYTIRDKQGKLHEVTTVKKEEIMKGDVKGTRWLFETKPLDDIKPEEEILVIQAVTQEDIIKGDVTSTRWKFETQPLDSLTTRERRINKTVEDIQKGNVKENKKFFEGGGACHREYEKMENIADVHEGHVKTSVGLFENKPIDSLRGEEEKDEYEMINTEDNQKECKEKQSTQRDTKLSGPTTNATEDASDNMIQNEPSKTEQGVKLCQIEHVDSNCLEKKKDFMEKMSDTLDYLYECNVIHSSGTAIEANENGGVNLAKYDLLGSKGPKILKEENAEGSLKAIVHVLMFVLNVDSHVYLVNDENEGNVQITELGIIDDPLLSKTRREVQIIEDLSQSKAAKKGILMQDSTPGHATMSVYTLNSFQKNRTLPEKTENIKSAIVNPLVTMRTQDCKDEETLPMKCLPDYETDIFEQGVETEGHLKQNYNKQASVQSVAEVNFIDIITSCNKVSSKIKHNTTLQGNTCGVNADLQTCCSEKQLDAPLLNHVIRAIDTNSEEQELDMRHKNKAESEVQIPSELEAALLSLRLATAEARNLHHAVQLRQKDVSSPLCKQQQKDVCIMTPQQVITSEIARKTQGTDEDKMESHYVLIGKPSLDNCHITASVQSLNEHDVIKPHAEEQAPGKVDVQCAMRSLQSTANEHWAPDKQEIVKGDYQAALLSLERSNINVSKGDFKTAMIFRNAGQNPSSSKGPQGIAEKPIKNSQSSPSVGATVGVELTASLSTTPAALKSGHTTHNTSTEPKNQLHNPPPLPPKSCKKPAIPPKPENLVKIPRPIKGCTLVPSNTT